MGRASSNQATLEALFTPVRRHNGACRGTSSRFLQHTISSRSKSDCRSSREDSAILFESGHQVEFLIDLHQVVDGRHIWRLPSMRSGALKVLWDTGEPWRHEYARIDMTRDGAYSVPFRTVDRHGRNA